MLVAWGPTTLARKVWSTLVNGRLRASGRHRRRPQPFDLRLAIPEAKATTPAGSMREFARHRKGSKLLPGHGNTVTPESIKAVAPKSPTDRQRPRQAAIWPGR